MAGESMVPAFRPGDRLVVAKRIPLRPGHVVAIRDPRDGSRLLVKRVAAISGRLVEVRGDNELASTDSRTFGLLPRRTVVGTVLYRYGPPGRVGWWP